MKVLWISNIPFGPHSILTGQKNASSGGWLGAAYEAINNEDSIELCIVTVSRVSEIKRIKDGRHTFLLLPGGYPFEYNCKESKNRRIWESIKNEFMPDVIQVWGTEFSHGYLALQVMKELPSVIYMQGVMSQLARHYLSGISYIELIKSITFRDILRWDWILKQQSNFHKRSLTEAKMIQISGNVIVENQWCEIHCKSLAANCNAYYSKLSINEVFFQEEWSIEKMTPYTIMSNAAGYPIKGLHVLLHALSIVIKKYPSVILNIPGEKSPLEKNVFEQFKIGGYSKYIKKLILKLKLENHICFLGQLSNVQMAKKMATTNVFVIPSSIENHSSTLIEAMIVGAPCISSHVGGVTEYLTHNNNGLLYRFEEYEILAEHIIKVFSDVNYATQIALNAKSMMRNSRNSINLRTDFLNIYDDILKV
jgi:glycogen synthase